MQGEAVYLRKSVGERANDIRRTAALDGVHEGAFGASSRVLLGCQTVNETI